MSVNTINHYGRGLAEQLRAKGDFINLTGLEQYILNRGHQFCTKEKLVAGYDRQEKSNKNILLSENEFIEEATLDFEYDMEIIQTIYNKLIELYSENIIEASEFYRFARYRWCFNDVNSLIAYQIDRDKWEVNNCSTLISNSEAIAKINNEWGFDESRISIIGTPYYDASDWQFIRFDCAGVSWLWSNQELNQIYD